MIKLGRTIRAQPTAARSLFLSTLPLPTRVTYAPGSVVEAVRVWLRQVKVGCSTKRINVPFDDSRRGDGQVIVPVHVTVGVTCHTQPKF